MEVDTETDNLLYKDFPQVCRICLRKQNNLVNIFDSTFEDFKKVVYVFREVFAEKIIKNDGRPEQICCECINRIKQINDFVILYYKSKRACEKVLEQKHDEEVSEEEKCHDIISNSNCNFCGFDFRLDPCKKTVGRTMRLLKGHILDEHLIEIRSTGDLYNCVKCKVHFKKLNEIENHFLSDEHQDRFCSNCKLQFNTVKDCFMHTKSCKCKAKKRGTSYVENENYRCIHCHNEEINGFEQVLQHFREKHEKNYVCMICEKTVNLHMELHLHKHRPMRMKFLCLRCLQHFQTDAQLADHKKNVDHSTKKCDICGMVVKSRKFSEHKASHEDTTYICELCGASFNERNSYTRHYRVKHLGHRYYCDRCPQSYSTYNDLVRHITRLHPGTKIDKQTRKSKTDQIRFRNYQQDKSIYDSCDKSHFQSSNHEIRLQRCEQTVICLDPACQQTFPNKGILLEHMSSQHEKFTCDTCNKVYFNPILYRSHCLLHVWHATSNNSNTTESTSCRICSENYPDATALSSHVVKQHNLHLCSKEDCGEIFACMQTLQKHKLDVHKKAEASKSPQFICPICNQKFLTARKFSVHQERHNSSRKFKCDVCSLMFSTAGQLRVHVRTHTGERPYACRFCSKTFASSYAKKLHERIHTGEKPYSCPYCEQRFSDGSHRRQHILQHQKKNSELQLLQQPATLNTNQF